MTTPPQLWAPSAAFAEQTAMHRFLAANGFDDYQAAWRWSVEDVGRFWAAVADWFHVRWEREPDAPLGAREMPGAEWFPGGRLSYAEHVFRDRDPAATAIRFASETRAPGAWTWGDLSRETARIRAGLVARGVGEGDRVCAYLPNIPETVAAFLATASLGAIWSSAAPEFGARSVIDRFEQIEPKVLLAVDGYVYGDKRFDRSAQVEEIHAAVGGELVRLGYLDSDGWEEGFLGPEEAPLEFAATAFDHPLWVLFSSGTTGLPKAIVHGQGGILLEHLKQLALHSDVRPGDRMLWFTTTGWMMWNYLVGALLAGAEIVLYDGSPAGEVLWDLAAEVGVTIFGTSPAWIDAQRKAGARPAEGRDLAIRAVGSTGAPLSPEGFQWIYDQLGPDLWLFSISGGTDVCTAFVGGVPTLPVHAGEIQARALGCKVEARGGELVITAPMPSMPVGFWKDPDGSAYRAAYFDVFPGIWHHGDFVEITDRGSLVISGRSDATINRGGVRMGTAEIYRAVLALDAIVDALVVDYERPDGASRMPLFVVLRGGAVLDDELRREIAARIRRDCSPRHVPDEVIAIDEVPRTLSGKALELPVKRILQGHPLDRAVSLESLANPHALDPFVELASSGP